MTAEREQSSLQRWSSQDFRPKERFEAWQEALNRSHLHWDLSEPGETAFSGDIWASKLQDLQIVQCVCQPCSGFRGNREIAANSGAYYGLLLINEGQEEVEVRSRSVLLEPGKILLWDSTVPMNFTLHSPVNKITVLVPQSRMHNALPQSPCLVGKSIDWRRGLGAVAASHIAALCSQAGHIEAEQVRPAVETTLELITSSLSWLQVEAGRGIRAELLAEIKRYIEKNLRDPELGPQALADRFGVSVRYLHLLFGEEEATVSRWILERRLEKCRRELIVAGAHKNITDVAFDWGFNSAAHFSRVFKKRFGTSPRTYRQNKVDQ